jgi:hypothetical protein
MVIVELKLALMAENISNSIRVSWRAISNGSKSSKRMEPSAWSDRLLTKLVNELFAFSDFDDVDEAASFAVERRTKFFGKIGFGLVASVDSVGVNMFRSSIAIFSA